MTLQDLIKTIDARILMIKMEQFNRIDCTWSIGLDDNKGEPQINYIKCESEEIASEIINTILPKSSKYIRGEDYGEIAKRNFIYFKVL